MIGSGLLLFFLLPGLLAYCAIYGLFHSRKSIAPEPPGVNTIEAVVVILLCSAIVHAVSALLIAGNAAFCAKGGCPLTLPMVDLDPYARAFRAVDKEQIDARPLGGLLVLALAQGLVAYSAVRIWLGQLARHDRLPAWIYGWAVDIANAADNDDTLVIAYVLTNHEIRGKAVIYGGLVFDLGLKTDGCISRLTLWDCERYMADLDEADDVPTLRDPSSRFPFMMIEASQIRNVAFRIVRSPDPDIESEDVAQPQQRPTSPP